MASRAPIPVHTDVDRAQFETNIRPSGQPAILKGLANHWPAVKAARQSSQALGAYLNGFDVGASVDIAVCPRDQKGRFFYNAALTGLNYQHQNRTFASIVNWCLKQIDTTETDAVYVQAQPIAAFLPGLLSDLKMELLDQTVQPRLWLGNSLKTQTHFDYFSNVAVHVAGKKTFTLFPPSQTKNLYPGPLEMTPAGVPVSMALLDAPDFERFPRLAEALDNGLTAELEPGDALFIPALWWHHVDTQGPLNMLVNYWWSDVRGDLFNPMTALMVATMAFKEMPPHQREAWHELVSYFVFENAGDPVAHLPQRHQGLFQKDISPQEMARLRQRVVRGS